MMRQNIAQLMNTTGSIGLYHGSSESLVTVCPGLQCNMSNLLTGRRLLFENAQQSLKAIQSLSRYQQLILQPFSLEEVQQYMRVALDRHNITDTIAAAVHERTGGLPLYVEQVPSGCCIYHHICCCCADSRFHWCHVRHNSLEQPSPTWQQAGDQLARAEGAG